MNFNTYRFHPSSIKSLMVTSRKKGELSETTKAFLQEVYIKEIYLREKTDKIGNKYMLKGTMAEQLSIDLLNEVFNKNYLKNEKYFKNDYLIGTPDIVGDELIDIKTSWDIWTFFNVDFDLGNKDYYYQLLCYMELAGYKKSKLIYTLVNTPEIIMNDELYRLSFKVKNGEVDVFKNNFIFDDIEKSKRIKVFDFEYNEEIMQSVYKRIEECRNYLNTLHL